MRIVHGFLVSVRDGMKNILIWHSNFDLYVCKVMFVDVYFENGIYQNSGKYYLVPSFTQALGGMYTLVLQNKSMFF